MLGMVFADLSAAVIFLYARPLAVPGVSAMCLKPTSGLTLFRITGGDGAYPPAVTLAAWALLVRAPGHNLLCRRREMST
jgi:hypothetical protein